MSPEHHWNTRETESLIRYAEADVPTSFGRFRMVVYREKATGHEHVAVVHGNVREKRGVHVRVHSECLTSEVLHSLKCDCREQLEYALNHIHQQDCGIVLYLRQEGRGIGLGNKMRAYSLQQAGADTVDANRMLGFEDDLRGYKIAAEMLDELGVESIELLTNNPDKVEKLRKDGIEIEGRVPVHIEPNQHNRGYLQTKSIRMGHMLSNLGGYDAE